MYIPNTYKYLCATLYIEFTHNRQIHTYINIPGEIDIYSRCQGSLFDLILIMEANLFLRRQKWNFGCKKETKQASKLPKKFMLPNLIPKLVLFSLRPRGLKKYKQENFYFCPILLRTSHTLYSICVQCVKSGFLMLLAFYS